MNCPDRDAVAANLAVEVNQVTNDRRQQFPDALDDLPVDKGPGGCIDQLQPEPAIDLLHFDFEIMVFRQQGFGVVTLVLSRSSLVTTSSCCWRSRNAKSTFAVRSMLS